jgi:hypothetical protein
MFKRKHSHVSNQNIYFKGLLAENIEAIEDVVKSIIIGYAHA